MAGGDLLKTIAVNAERLGVATLWAPEHVVLFDKYESRYPYAADGKFAAPTGAPVLDPFIALATIGAVTSKSASPPVSASSLNTTLSFSLRLSPRWIS